MTKYQFFCKPNTHRQQFTYLAMASDSFLDDKQKLMSIGFEVEGDVIFAGTSQEAVDKFQSNYIHLCDEYNNAHLESGVATFIIESYQEIRRRLATRK